MTQIQVKFIEWLSAEDMNKASKEWLSELEFIKDEHLFFEDLIRSYTLQLIVGEKFSENKKIINTIDKSKEENNTLIRLVKEHENKLEIMVDGIDQLKQEEAYKNEHRTLIIEVSEFLKEYQNLKTALFKVIKNIMKSEKQKRLLE